MISNVRHNANLASESPKREEKREREIVNWPKGNNPKRNHEREMVDGYNGPSSIHMEWF